MIEEEYTRLENLFRRYQGPPLDRKNMKGLLTEVESFIRQFGNEPRLVILHEEVKSVLE
jgi:hypothetical protein